MKTYTEIEKLADEVYPTTDMGKLKSNIGFIKGYKEDMADILKVTRVEVIDEYGRRYTKHNCKVELSYQDDGRTLKVFVKPLNKQDK
jgi:hypothetical protein